jgi:hypothetical protein
MHPDHVNGLSTDEGRARFPKRKLVVTGTDCDFWYDDNMERAPEEQKGFLWINPARWSDRRAGLKASAGLHPASGGDRAGPRSALKARAKASKSKAWMVCSAPLPAEAGGRGRPCTADEVRRGSRCEAA